jgi:zinc transport system substrate-binding protein
MRLRAVVDGKAQRPVFFSHPVFQYLQRKYYLNAKSVHWEPDAVPSQRMWDEFTQTLDEHRAKWMVWEGKPIQDNVKRLAAIGLHSTTFEPCGNMPADSDFLSTMHRNIDNLANALEQ